MSNNLTARQEKFARCLFREKSQYESWGLAGYSTNYSRESIDRNASVLANSTKIKQRLRELRDKAAEIDIISYNERRKRLTEYIKADITDYIDDKGAVKLDKSSKNTGAIAEYEVIESKRGKRKSIKLHNPIAAISELNKMEHVYETQAGGGDDNRTYNIVVADEATRESVGRLMAGGKRGQVVEGEVRQLESGGDPEGNQE